MIIGLKKHFYKKISLPFIKLMKQGISSEKLALTAALGIIIGVFPVLGSTTLLCTLAAVIFQLNLPAIQSVNYLIYPMQIILLIPFYKIGNFLFGNGSIQLTAGKVIELIRNDTWVAIQILWSVTLHAIVVWLIISPIFIAIIYVLLLPILKKMERNNLLG